MKLAISSPPEDGFVEGAATGIVRQAASSPCSPINNVDKRALCKWNNLSVSDLGSIYHLSIGHETCVD